jgi:hypothetical protein
MSYTDMNPFQNSDISVPDKYHEYLQKYTQRKTGGHEVNIDKSPFRRMVDMWFLAICVAVRDGLNPAELPSQKKMVKIIDGSILSNDPWRVNAIMLIAIGRGEAQEILTQPNAMMKLANGLAVAGIPRLCEMLEDGDSEPIWNLSENILNQ